jgi:archaellum component FlaF (FlaF/FlaG flagellin family)
MDKLIESLNFASRSYWGDPNRFLFYSSIESFQDSITYDIGDNRAVRTNFNITLNGYLIPDSLNKKLATPSNTYSISRVVFGLETSTGTEEFGARIKKGKSGGSKSVLLNDSVNNVNYITNNTGTDTAAITYLGVNKTVTGVFVSTNTVTFPNGFLDAPSGLPATSVNNFTFFVNGQYIEASSIISFTNNIVSSTLVLNTTALQYELEASDVIIGVGKFN